VSTVVTVHHLELSRSTRVLWALEELGVAYELKTYKRHPKTFRAGPEIKQVHAVGRFPVLTIGDVVLAESGAILEHLADTYDALRPKDASGLRHYRFWLHFAEGSLMPPLLVALITGRLRTGAPWPVSMLTSAVANKIDQSYTTPQLADLLGPVDAHLAEHTWFAGENLSMADIQMSYPVMAALERVRGAKVQHPNMVRWAAAVQARPAYQKALEVGGPLLPG